MQDNILHQCLNQKVWDEAGSKIVSEVRVTTSLSDEPRIAVWPADIGLCYIAVHGPTCPNPASNEVISRIVSLARQRNGRLSEPVKDPRDRRELPYMAGARAFSSYGEVVLPRSCIVLVVLIDDNRIRGLHRPGQGLVSPDSKLPQHHYHLRVHPNRFAGREDMVAEFALGLFGREYPEKHLPPQNSGSSTAAERTARRVASYRRPQGRALW